jgi:hypothetical protein
MYTSMLDVAASNKNLKVDVTELTDWCNMPFSKLIRTVTNMLCAYLAHNIYNYRFADKCLFAQLKTESVNLYETNHPLSA